MKSMFYSLFANYSDIIIFLHVISAVIWVGGMIAMRFAAHYSFAQIEDESRLDSAKELLMENKYDEAINLLNNILNE